MKRVQVRIGDVFSVPLDKDTKKYFQYVASDLTMLGSNVIRAFKRTYSLDDNPDLHSVVGNEVEFFAHVIIRWGLRMNLWDKAGHVNEVGDVSVLFRGTSDYGTKLGEEPIKVSSNWYVWRVNEDFHDVGTLRGEYRNSEIGIVVSPVDIVDRMRTGKYDFVYPDFE